MREYFEMSLDDLREVAAWAAGFAERALAVYEERVPGDARPRLALEGAKEFARGGGRTNALRKLAMDAYRASREAVDGAASEAANAASLAAALPFTAAIPAKQSALLEYPSPESAKMLPLAALRRHRHLFCASL